MRMGALPRFGAAAVAVLSLSGCWLQPGYGPENQRWNPVESSLTLANVESLAPAWSTETSYAGTPLVAEGRVLVGGIDAEDTTGVQALSLASGAPLWTAGGDAVYPGLGVEIGPTISDGDVWIGGFPDPAPAFSSNFTAFDLQDGSTTATFSENGLVSHPVRMGDVVAQTTRLDAVPTSPGTLIVRDRTSMATVWTAALGGPPSAPVISDDRIYVGAGTRVYAFAAGGCGSPTCTPLWSRDRSDYHTESKEVRVVAVTPAGEVLVHDHATYVDPYTGERRGSGLLAAYTPDGTGLWSASVGSLSSLAVTDSTVYVGGYRMVGPEFEPPEQTPYLEAIENGARVWRASVSETPGDFVVAGGVLYAGRGSTVDAYDTAGCGSAVCSPVTSIAVDGTVEGMSVTAGRLLVASTAGATSRVTAFAPT
jgi:hypothetical protein